MTTFGLSPDNVERILTTHVGSLPRPRSLLDLILAKEEGRPVDARRTRVDLSISISSQMDRVEISRSKARSS